MRCSDCKRLLTAKPALVIPTRNGDLQFGPICAKRYIVRPTRSVFPAVERLPRVRPVPVDASQLALEFL